MNEYKLVSIQSKLRFKLNYYELVWIKTELVGIGEDLN
jgi:hypothetical protein